MEIKEKDDLKHQMLLVVDQLKEMKKYASVHVYKSVLNSFVDFYGDKDAEIPLGEVFTEGRLKDYQDWMRGCDLSWNTVSSYMRTLRAVYNRLFLPGSEKNNPRLFDGVYTKVEPGMKRSLTEQQMQKLLKANYDDQPEEVKAALAMFLLMFLFRGMPFIDLVYLRKKDVKGNLIVYCRRKTGRKMTVRIEPEALALIELFKEKNPNSPYLFPILDSKIRDEWKLFECYLDALRNFNRKLETISKQLLPGVKISSYTARHTWATLAFYRGVSIGIISKSLGHSSIKVTETYLKPFEDEKIHEANRQMIDAVA